MGDPAWDGGGRDLHRRTGWVDGAGGGTTARCRINDPAASYGVLGYQRTQQVAGNGPVEIQLRISNLFGAMMLNISADDFGGHLVTDGTGKISILPKLPAPQAPFDTRKLLGNRSSTQALATSHDLDDRVPGWEGAKIWWSGLPSISSSSDVILLRNIGKQFPYSLLDLAVQNTAPIFGRPNQMVQSIVDRMRGASENHADTVADPADLDREH